MFEFSVIISITLNNKAYDEAISLERDLIEDIGKECDPRFKIKTYLHSKTFDTKFKIPTAEKDLIDKLNSKKCIFITPNIKDYDVIIHLLAYIKRWRNRMDEDKYGRIVFYCQGVSDGKHQDIGLSMQQYYEQCLSLELDDRFNVKDCACVDEDWISNRMKGVE